MKPLYVAGTAFFAPGYPDLAAWLGGVADSSVEEPVAELMGSRIRRGTSLLTRMSVDVATRAGRAAGFELATTASVFGSCFGEIQIAVVQLDMMREGDGIVSPARFKNSVHNTGSGVFSIAAENRGFTTAIAGGLETVATGLLEAFLLGDDGHDRVLVAVGDEPLPIPLHAQLPYAGLAAGLALTTQKPDGRAARLENLRMVAPVPERPRDDDPFARNPCRAAIDLLTAIARETSGTIALTRSGSVGWAIDLSFVS